MSFALKFFSFSFVIHLCVSLIFLGGRLNSGMPTNEALGKFFIATGVLTLIDLVIAWFFGILDRK